MSAGIDYGLGSTNVDKKNGIRYGVISQNSVMPEAMEDVEYDYGEPTCPKCGNSAVTHDSYEGDTEQFETGRGCADFVCTDCEYVFDSMEAYSDEAIGWNYDGDGYQLTNCLDNDIFVIASPYYTKAQFCSPCVPGAGNLDSADEDGIETYCLGHDWFESGVAPYPVYSVATRELVAPEA